MIEIIISENDDNDGRPLSLLLVRLLFQAAPYCVLCPLQSAHV